MGTKKLSGFSLTMSLSDVTAHSILCCWTNKANNFFVVFYLWCLRLAFTFWSVGLKPVIRSSRKSLFLQFEWVLFRYCTVCKNFDPTCPQIFESLLHAEIRIRHITYEWYNKMNSLSFLWANNTLSHSQSKSNCRVTNKSKSWLTKLSSFALILNSLGVIGVSHH